MSDRRGQQPAAVVLVHGGTIWAPHVEIEATGVVSAVFEDGRLASWPARRVERVVWLAGAAL
jgi:hypothetical protein